MTALIIPEPRRELVSKEIVPPSEAAVLLQVISRAAADKEIDLDRVERLLLMHEKITAKQAEKAFIEAMAKFKETAPRIMKAKLVSFPTQDGGTTSYRHATLGAVCQAAVAGLGAVGISHRWDLSTADGKITVTCVLTHTGGHSTKTVLAGAADASGKKNAIQQVASTITYLERYTLLAATGLATEDQDDDGTGGDPEPPPEAPEGYESWRADMDLVETHAANVKAWKGSNPIFTTYAATYDIEWLKSQRAARVDR
jgi:ERF superfamily